MGLALMVEMAGVDLWPKVETQVKVFESRVTVASKDRQGREVEARDVDEGFKANIVLARLSREKPLDADDFSEWRSVMVFDQALSDRARARALPAMAVPQPIDMGAGGPASTSEKPATEGSFEDIRKREH
jgi:hypothetical protein